jgi:hypothetical protein
MYCLVDPVFEGFFWQIIVALFWCLQAVLKATRMQLEREMMLEDICCVQDLPAFNLLSPSKT